ncbi:hypothetical protein [Pseudooceanicola sp.]|uniref:hypothetical protein n=1 Tax=Pseudooceanicola sp. TaxID=1914328 RepID=UPI0035C70A2C
MAVHYRILSDIGLVYVRYSGVATVQETVEAFTRFSRDPDSRPELKHLIDLKDIVEYDRSYVDLMKFQALQVDTLMASGRPSFMIYLAPTRISRSMAHSALKSWDGLEAMVVRVVQDEAEALEMLGLEQRCIDELMNRA